MRVFNLSLPFATLPALVVILLLAFLWLLLLVLLLWFSLPRRHDEVSAPEPRVPETRAPEMRERDLGAEARQQLKRSGRKISVSRDDFPAADEPLPALRPRVFRGEPDTSPDTARAKTESKARRSAREAKHETDSDDLDNAFDTYTCPRNRRDDFDF